MKECLVRLVKLFSSTFAGGNFLRYLCSLFSNTTGGGGVGVPSLSEKHPIPLPQYPLPVPSRADLPLPLFSPPPPLLPPPPPPQPPQSSKSLPEEEDATRNCSDNGSAGSMNNASLDSRYQLAKRFLDSLLLQKAAFQQDQKRTTD